MREVVTFQFAGQQLVGTLHRRATSAPETAPDEKRLALLWLNSGYLPRSPVGDMLAHLSDHFADKHGICSLRVDLPGLGDSQGTVAGDTQTYFSQVVRGLNVEEANAIARDVCQRFGFSGVVMGGICGAAITSIYAADAARGGPIVGLALLDPSFKLVQPFQGLPATGSAVRRPPRHHRIREAVATLRVAVLKRGWGQFLRRIWGRCKTYLTPLRRAIKSFRGSAYLPADANRELFEAFRRVSRSQLPIVVVVPGDERVNEEHFDYVGLVMKHHGHAITRHFAPGTNHSFVEGDGALRVRRAVSDWLSNVQRGEPIRASSA